jgi:ABC-2 type transport system ATP-binding protein
MDHGRGWRWPTRWRLAGSILGIIGVLALAAAGIAVGKAASAPAPVSARNLMISVVDGPRDNQHVRLDATFFLPAGGGRVPAVLLAHGFGDTKNSVRAQAKRLARQGFAVLTWSARGFGRSTGQIALDSPDYEVKDVEQLVSWLARQPRVLLDHPGDPRVGIAGASYGGAIALLAAAYDHRIDAIVPSVTWNNLATALFPDAAGGGPADGVFKKQWAGLLFADGSAALGGSLAGSTTGASGASGAGSTTGASGTTGASSASGAGGAAGPCGRFLPELCAIYQRTATLGRATPQAIATLLRSSPVSVQNRIDVPTLLIQGEHDSLFGLDQADANYQAIRRNGAPVSMVWFAGGHDGGNQEASRIDGLTAQWFDRWLKPRRLPWSPGTRTAPGARSVRVATGLPGFSVSRDLGFDASTGATQLGVATAARYPGLAGTRRTLVRLAGPPQPVTNPPGGAPPSFSSFPGLGASGLTFDLPGQSAAFTSAALSRPLQVTGSPTVRVRVTTGRPGATLFAELYDVDQAGTAVLPFALAAPARVTGTAASRPGAGRQAGSWDVTVRLPAVDYQFAAGHRLRLVLTTTDFGYATSPDPATYQVSLAGPGVTLPGDPALVISSGGLPGWTWGGPLAALVAAAVILATGRRRRRRSVPADGLADVPLDIAGLTKRFGDGQLAVDGLSLRVERQQILGLLGPNGAGKTTTLRALMGLIQPDAGVITIFGRAVHAGSPALSRLGAFVEGPGFLPHLSGRANLEVYWRATGRPADGSHLPQVLEIAGLGAAVDRPVRTYSRGMRQRLAIAQAMLGLPELLVLDEPMNGLDPPQIREMREVLTQYAGAGRTVILSSHMLAEVELTCTDVIVMNRGRRIAGGGVGEVAGDGGAVIIGTPDVDRALDVLAGLAGAGRGAPGQGRPGPAHNEPARGAPARSGAADADRAAVPEASGIGGAQRHPEGVLVELGDQAASVVVAALVGAGVAVERVTPQRRLEDAFLALIAGRDEAGADEAGSGGAVADEGSGGREAGDTAAAEAEGAR